jgi:pimeloyl-ACP methyl ester carboxylesterase
MLRAICPICLGLCVRGFLGSGLSSAIGSIIKGHTAIPDARLVTVANAGHGVPYDAPEGFLAAVREFSKG